MKKQPTTLEQELTHFFDFANPKEWESLLWEWFKTTITGSYNQLSKKERSNLIYTFEMINKLIQKMGNYSQQE
ncbi:MAG: hypothetical protein WCP74_00070 [Sphingobacteriia bacterium]|jgi:hypothetical protein